MRTVRKGRGFPAGEEPPRFDWQGAAYLSGGPKRLLSAAIARLVQSGAVRLSDDGQSLVPTDAATPSLTPVEGAVLSALPLKKDDKAGMKALNERVELAYAEESRRMQEDGLLFTSGQATATGFLTAVPLFAVLVGFGLTRLVMGLANDKPVLFLFFVVFFGVGGVALLVVTRPFRTRRGDQALNEDRLCAC